MEKMLSDKLIRFFSKFTPVKYQKGETVIRAQDVPQGIYYLSQGYIKMSVVYEDGKELTVNIFKPGSYFPMIWAIGNIKNRHYYQALEPIKVYRAPKEEVMKFIKDNPDVLMELTMRIIIGLNGILTNMELTLFGSAYHRVLSALYLCAKRFGQNKDGQHIVIKPSFTHQDIANLAGLTRETVSATMIKAEKERIISYHRGVLKFHDLSKLEEKLSIYQSGFTASSIIQI